MTSINFPNTPSQGDTHEHLGITWICTHIAPVPRWAKTGDQAFNNIHLGAFAVAPTLDNNGNALIAGQTYWDTVLSGFYIYNGTTWELPAVIYTGDGLLPANNLSDVTDAATARSNLGVLTVTLSGQSSIYVSTDNNYTITNYDSFSTYSVVVDVGSVSRVDEVITVTAPASGASQVLTVTKDGVETTFNITILAAGVATPTNTSPSNGVTDQGETNELTSSAFSWLGVSDTHASSDWQIATDAGFTTIIDSTTADAVNLTTWTPTGIVVSQTYYWRVKHTGASNGSSGWSTATSFTTKATFDPIIGTASVFESASSYYISVTTLDSTKAIVTYQDIGNSSYGTACVLSISGTTITAGTPVVFESASSTYISVTTLDSTKAIVTYTDGGNAYYGTACVLSISGTTITAGTPVVFNSADSTYISVTTLDSTKAIVTYTDGGNSSYGTACVLSISGTTITTGTPVVFESASSNYISVTTLDSTKAIVTYRDNGNAYYGTACVLSISGTTITAGTPVVFNSSNSNYTSVTTLDSTKAIVTYRDNGNSSYGTACVLSISGTTITAGTPVVFESASSTYISVTTLDSTKAIVTYSDNGNADYGTACVLSISGTVITAGTPVVFESANSTYISVTTLDSTKAIVTYQDGGNSYYGTANTISGL